MAPTTRDYNALAHLIKVLRYSPIITPSADAGQDAPVPRSTGSAGAAYSFDQWVSGVALWLANQNPRFDTARFIAATKDDTVSTPRAAPRSSQSTPPGQPEHPPTVSITVRD